MVQSEQYHVDKLDWDRRKAFVRKVESEYYTDAQSYAKVKILHVLRAKPAAEAVAAEYGEVEVIRKAIGYKKIKFYTQENLGWGDILLPEDIYHTQATWFTLPQELVAELGVPTRVPQSQLIDALSGLANLLHGLASLLLMCDGRDMGVVIGDRNRDWFFRPSAPGQKREAPPEEFEATIFLYDQYSGGIGLAEALHPLFRELLVGAQDRLLACACESGCPSCVGPELEVGDTAKHLALRLLQLMLSRMDEDSQANQLVASRTDAAPQH
jgi:DEAD/DEAH box helicase domain-containing protein